MSRIRVAQFAFLQIREHVKGRSKERDAATAVYAAGHDLKDPLISPVYGDMHGS